MTVWSSTGADTLSTSMAAVGRGVLRCAIVVDSRSAKTLAIPISGPVPGSLLDCELTPGVLPSTLDHCLAKWSSLAPYGKEEGHLLLVGESSIDSASFEAIVAVAGDLVNRLVEMNFEMESLSHEVLRSYEAINFFYDISAAFSECLSASALSETILERILSMVSARRAMMILSRTRPDSALEIVALRGDTGEFQEGQRFHDFRLLSLVPDTENSMVIDEVDGCGIDLCEISSLATKSLLIVPLRWESKNLGLIVLADNGSTETIPFTAADGKLVETIATPAASILNTFRLMELQHEIDLAHRIQMLLLPATPPKTESLDIAAVCKMAGGVGGDMYDYIVTRDGILRVVVADVSGHNLAAALMMAVGRAVIRIEAANENSPTVVASRINENMYDDLSRSELFITFFLASFCPVSRSLSYCSAGHNPPLLCRTDRSRKIERLEAAGVPTGILRSFAFEERQAQLRSNDVLVIYTDGITEAKNLSGELFGEERLKKVLFEFADGSAEGILSQIVGAVNDHTQGQPSDDDRTVVVVKVVDFEGDK